MTLQSLYSINEAGKTLMWQIEVNDTGYRTITGLKDGKRIISEWTICEPTNIGRSNYRDIKEQAIFEAEAKWKKKQDQEGYHILESDINNKSLFVEPMLAQKYKDHKDYVTFPTMLDRKYNGMRQITTKDGAFSRKGKVIISAPHITDILKPLFAIYPNMVLDGELYNHEYRYKLNELLSIVKRSKPTKEDIKNSERLVKYYVYDGYGFDNITEDTPCIERRKALQKLLEGINFIVPVEFFTPLTEIDMGSLYRSFIEDGYEGSIIRNPNGKYHHRRHKDLLKFKPEDDDEAIIIAVHEGKGNWSGCAKTVTLLWKGREVDATFKCPYERAQRILQTKNVWIGKEVTFKYFGLTGKGLPNYAQLDPDNCEVAH